MDLNVRRLINIQIDSTTWPGGKVPKEITNLVTTSPRLTNVFAALLHTAVWTRPPSSYGFDLADRWAWLRYGRAIANTQDLRLRPEWNEIDAHQKMILSDDFGIGFTTELFADELDFQIYADTNSFLPLVSLNFALGRTPKKRGPKKSPDYIVLDTKGKFSVLECKGGQGSLNKIKESVAEGVAQKKNLQPLAGSTLRHSLVAGLFIPQASSSDDACIHIVDPVDTDLAEELEELSRERIMIGIVQVGLAKHFALMGLFSLGNALSRARAVDGDPLPAFDATELRGVRFKDDRVLEFILEDPETRNQKRKSKSLRTAFRMQCPIELYESFINGRDLNDNLLRIADSLINKKWVTLSDDNGSTIKSPLGFEISLHAESIFAR